MVRICGGLYQWEIHRFKNSMILMVNHQGEELMVAGSTMDLPLQIQGLSWLALD